MHAAYRVEMTESEAGWGQRPDGYIYGVTKESVEKKLKEIASKAQYEEFSFPSGEIVLVEVTAEFEDFLKLANNEVYWTPIGKHAGDLTRIQTKG